MDAKKTGKQQKGQHEKQKRLRLSPAPTAWSFMRRSVGISRRGKETQQQHSLILMPVDMPPAGGIENPGLRGEAARAGWPIPEAAYYLSGPSVAPNRVRGRAKAVGLYFGLHVILFPVFLVSCVLYACGKGGFFGVLSQTILLTLHALFFTCGYFIWGLCRRLFYLCHGVLPAKCPVQAAHQGLRLGASQRTEAPLPATAAHFWS